MPADTLILTPLPNLTGNVAVFPATNLFPSANLFPGGSGSIPGVLILTPID